MNNLTAETTIIINATAAAVWKAITTPELIKKYLYGTNVTSDCKEGSTITYKGEYNGKAYEDKGMIKKLVPEQLFESTYWSPMSGKEDKPENYNTVIYKLAEHDGKTTVTLSQDNINSEAEKQQAVKNWDGTLEELKKAVEEL